MLKKSKIVSTLLFFTMLLQLFVVAQSSDTTQSRIIYQNERTVSNGLVYREQISMDNTYGPQKSFLFEYTPRMGTSIVSAYGDSVYGSEKLSTIIKNEKAKGNRVVGGINADFFSLQTGVPMSAIISDGELVSSDDERACMGFLEDGSAIVGYPKINIKLTNGNNNVFQIGYLNKYPSPYALYLQSDKFAQTTKTKSPSTEIILFAYSNRYTYEELPKGADGLTYANGYYYELTKTVPKIGEETKVIAVQVIRDSVNATIPKGAYVLCADNTAYDFIPLQIKQGDEFTLSITAEKNWDKVKYAVGCGSIIAENSKYTDKYYEEAIYNVTHPRTAAGITADGKVIFYCIDGRQSGYSTGIKMEPLANELISRGCVTVINFDGGGSTTVSVALPGYADSATKNKPSDGTERGVSDALLFLNNAKDTGIPSKVHSYPENPLILAGGGSFEISDYLLTDENYFPVKKDDKTTATFRSSESGLSISGKTVTAQKTVGEFPYEADVTVGDTTFTGIAGTATVVDKIDSLSVSPSNVVLQPGESVQLSVEAKLGTVLVNSNCSNYLWDLNNKTAFGGANGTVGNSANNPTATYTIKSDSLSKVDVEHPAAGTFATLTKDGVLKPLVENTTFTVSAVYGDKVASIVITVLPSPFLDIKGHWASDAILKCKNAGLVNGEVGADGTYYYPERQFSRAEFCAILVRLLGLDVTKYNNTILPFTDVASIDSWAQPYIKTLYSLGYLNMITENNTFRAKDSITRLDVMTILGSLCKTSEYDTINFSDRSKIPNNKYQFVLNSLSAGLFEGYEDNTLRPEVSLTRAQAAAVFVRLQEMLKSSEK